MTAKQPQTTPKAPIGQSIGYIRVNSVGQKDARRLDDMEFDRGTIDKASGKDTQRPQLQAMLAHVREGDHVYVQSMDRLARSQSDLEGMSRVSCGVVSPCLRDSENDLHRGR